MSEGKSIYQRLIEAQAEMEQPTLNASNPHFKSKYADLAEIIRVVLPPLRKSGLFLSQQLEFQKGEAYTLSLVTRVYDGTGESLTLGSYPITSSTPQQIGSEVTYARRYSLSSAFAIVADDDDDGNSAQGKAGKPNVGKPEGKKKPTLPPSYETFRKVFGDYVKDRKESGITGATFKPVIEQHIGSPIAEATDEQLLKGLAYISSLIDREKDNQDVYEEKDIPF